MTDALTPLHMGALHPVEQLVVLAVAFGPFLVLFVVVYVARRRAVAEEGAEALEAREAQGVQDARDGQRDLETGRAGDE